MIENTSQRDNLDHVLGIMSEGQSGYIEGMEAAGQRQVVGSDTMPSDAPWDDLVALGFVKGDPVSGDDLFVHCSLPDGWSKGRTDHSMWSTVLDERGIERVSVFYKAAFYDRSAFARIASPGGSRATEAIYGDGEPALPADWGRLTDDEHAAFWRGVEGMVESIADCPDVYGKYQPRVDALLALRS